MVSVDTLASVGATIALAEMLWPHETAQACKPTREYRTKLVERLLAPASVAGEILLAIGRSVAYVAAAVDGVDDLFARMLVRGGHDPRGEIDAHLDNLASRDAEVVLLEIGARDSRRLRRV